MRRPVLSDTLTALAFGACPDQDQLRVESVEISLPLIVRVEHGSSGPRFYAQPPWSAFRSGFEPVAHRARLSLAQVPTEPLPTDPIPTEGPARPAHENADPQPTSQPVPAG